jgi:ABC-type transport system substrate-binding protein
MIHFLAHFAFRILGFIFVSSLLVFASCSSKKQVKFEHAGGIFSMALDSDATTFDPAQVSDFHSNTVLSQLFEGLMSLNPESLQPTLQLAKKMKISSDGLNYEFVLKSGVYFHDSPVFTSEEDRLLTPSDVVFTFEKACRKEKQQETVAYTSMLKNALAGADDFHVGKVDSIRGIRVSGDTIRFELLEPDPNFLNKLAHINLAIVSKKAMQASGFQNAIGTGPFWLEKIEISPVKKIKLTKNELYYQLDKKGCSLPYLDGVEFIIETDISKQLTLFETGKTHFISALPSEKLSQIVSHKIAYFNSTPPKLIWRNSPLLATNYYCFNMKDPRFQDLRVRKAFNYAINRERLLNKVLKGQAHAVGEFGVIPPVKTAFYEYDFNSIKNFAYSYDSAQAVNLFKSAGYDSGKAFGDVVLRINFGDVHYSVAEEIASQLQSTLGINVIIEASDFEKYNSDIDAGKADLFRMAWYADYVSAESFLLPFYGKLVPQDAQIPSTINPSRYQNPLFDSHFEAARVQKRRKDRQLNYFLAEMELLKNPPMMILWYAGDNQLMYANVRNFPENPMSLIQLRSVYFKDWTKEEYRSSLEK